MDEYSSGMDPEMKKYFRKIVGSFFPGFVWMMVMATLGLFFGLGIVRDEIAWYHLVFYLVFLASFIWLLRYYYRLWGPGKNHPK